MAALGLTALAGWLTGWPPQLFAEHESSIAASKPNIVSSKPTISVRAAPAAQQSSAASTLPTISATATAGPSLPAPASSPVPGSSPAATVQAYFAAINAHDYAEAWKLGGKIAGPSYSAFVAGFDGTAEDNVTVISVSGDQVTAQLVADQTDGTVKDYSGVYTVVNGVIVQARVEQTN